jgi:VWFA-related protein
MRRILIAMLVAAAPLAAQQTPTPTFRSDVNAVLLDVRIVDRTGRFVDDLTKDDLRVFENGDEQPISTFGLVKIPIHPDERPRFSGKTVDADVASNERGDGRLFVILLDDYHTNQLRSVTVRALAREFIERDLNESDRAVVLTTSGRRDVSQEFTNNHQRLLTLVDRFEGGFQSLTRCGMIGRPDGSAVEAPGCAMADDRGALHTLSGVATWLASANGRRKAIVFISEGFDGRLSNSFDPAQSSVDADLDALTGDSVTKGEVASDNAAIAADLKELIDAAAKSNVSIYSIDPHGLPGASAAGVRPVAALAGEQPYDAKTVQSRMMLQTISNQTGGFALTQSNDFTGAFRRVVDEASSYYLIGYVPTNGARDGRFRRVEVRTNRSDLRVQARTGYTAAKDATPKRGAEDIPSRELTELMKSPVAVSGLTLRVGAIPFQGKNGRASVEVVADVQGHDLEFLASNQRSTGSLDLLMAIADADGHIKARERGSLDMRLSSSTRQMVADFGIRVLSRLDVAPGRYLLRIAGIDNVGRTRGSVQYDLDVPDFSKGPLTMSGLAVAAASEGGRPTTGSDREWKARFTVAPTALRTFRAGEALTVSGEIYPHDRKPGRIEVVTDLVGEDGSAAFSRRTLLDAAGALPVHHETMIPLDGVGRGNYVLSVRVSETANAKASASRQIPIGVR